MRFLLFLLFSAAWLRAEVVDRIAITIDYQVITESQIDEELRVAALLNHSALLRVPAARRDAADRLIQQLLIKREMALSHFAEPDPAELGTYLAGVKKEIAETDGLPEALRRYDLNETTLRDHLVSQLTTLRYVEFRFRPEVSVTEAAVQTYVRRNSNPGTNPGTPAKTPDEIRKLILAERTDAALDGWLEEARKRFNIVYLDKALQ